MELQEHVVVVPYVPHERLGEYYASADLFVLPSYSEGLPKVVIEAMGHSCPVVVSDIPAHRELIDDGVTGLTFETGNVNQLTRKITLALDDDALRKRLSTNARNTVEGRYTWADVAERLDSVYRAVLNGTAGLH